MRRLLKYLDSTDRSLRWAFFLPAGLGLSFVFLAMVEQLFLATDEFEYPARGVPGVFQYSTEAFLAAVTRTLFPAVISPRPWLVGVIMFTLDFLIRTIPIAYQLINFEYMRYRAPGMYPYLAAGAVGGLLGLLLVRQVMKFAADSKAK